MPPSKSVINNFWKTKSLRINYNNLSTHHPKEKSSLSSFFVVPNKKYIKVSGIDSRTFLQGLITNDINLLSNTCSNSFTNSCIWTAFLNTKGRIIADTMIYCLPSSSPSSSSPSSSSSSSSSSSTVGDINDDELLIECDSITFAIIYRQLKVYKLKSKITIKEIPELNSIFVPFLETKCESLGLNEQGIVACGKDTRLNSFGTRFVINDKTFESIMSNMKKRDMKKQESRKNNVLSFTYDQYRYTHGVAEGSEIIGSTPIECNLDFLSAVSFNKGCYIGQELVSRSKHTGVIRKRILPFVLDTNNNRKDSNRLMCKSLSQINEMILNTTNISNSNTTHEYHSIKKETPIYFFEDGTEIGKVVAFSDGVGLAMMRLQSLKEKEGKAVQVQGLPIKVMKPNWFET